MIDLLTTLKPEVRRIAPEIEVDPVRNIFRHSEIFMNQYVAHVPHFCPWKLRVL